MRISQCMIVKNEEANIQSALQWGQGIVWEQIVVDTGSTDRTVELAESMGARVYHFPWIDDFAAAKNYAIEKARGEWIAFLDADESFAGEEAQKLASLLKSLGDTETDAVMVSVVNLKEDGTVGTVGAQIRAFRNRPGIRYRRRVHEQLVADHGTRELHLLDATGSLSILHSGYSGKEYTRKKTAGRNFRLIQKELEDHPDDYELLGYLGDEYNSQGCTREAAGSYRQAIRQMPPVLDEQDARSAATFSGLLRIMTETAEPETEIWKIYEKATKLLPKEADFDYILGHHYASGGNYTKGGQLLEQAVEKLGQYGTCNRSMLLAGQLPQAYEAMAVCFFQEKNLEKAIYYSTSVLKYDPYAVTPLIILLKTLRGEGTEPLTPEDQVVEFLKKLYHGNPLKDRTMLLAAARRLEWAQLEKQLEEAFPG